MTNLKSNSSMLAKTPKRRVVSGEELEGSLGKVSGRTVGLHSHHPLVVWTRSELVEGGKKLANQKRRITAGRERAVTETAVCPVPLGGKSMYLRKPADVTIRKCSTIPFAFRVEKYFDK